MNWSTARGSKFYLQQPVIASPAIQQKMEKPQTAVSPLFGLNSVACRWLLADGVILSSKFPVITAILSLEPPTGLKVHKFSIFPTKMLWTLKH